MGYLWGCSWDVYRYLELTRVVLKSGGSDVEAACLHVSPGIFYTTRQGFVLALLETCNY